MKKISSTTVKEEYFVDTLKNGLKVYLIPKPKFHRTYALFATRFGSCDLEFMPEGFHEYLTVPARLVTPALIFHGINISCCSANVDTS